MNTRIRHQKSANTRLSIGIQRSACRKPKHSIFRQITPPSHPSTPLTHPSTTTNRPVRTPQPTTPPTKATAQETPLTHPQPPITHARNPTAKPTSIQNAKKSTPPGPAESQFPFLSLPSSVTALVVVVGVLPASCPTRSRRRSASASLALRSTTRLCVAALSSPCRASAAS